MAAVRTSETLRNSPLEPWCEGAATFAALANVVSGRVRAFRARTTAAMQDSHAGRHRRLVGAPASSHSRPFTVTHGRRLSGISSIRSSVWSYKKAVTGRWAHRGRQPRAGDGEGDSDALTGLRSFIALSRRLPFRDAWTQARKSVQSQLHRRERSTSGVAPQRAVRSGALITPRRQVGLPQLRQRELTRAWLFGITRRSALRHLARTPRLWMTTIRGHDLVAPDAHVDGRLDVVSALARIAPIRPIRRSNTLSRA